MTGNTTALSQMINLKLSALSDGADGKIADHSNQAARERLHSRARRRALSLSVTNSDGGFAHLSHGDGHHMVLLFEQPARSGDVAHIQRLTPLTFLQRVRNSASPRCLSPRIRPKYNPTTKRIRPMIR